MARWTGRPHTADVLSAADYWKERCFLADGSVLTDGPLWTRENFDKLKELFVDNPIEGDERFHDKLQQQIAAGGPQIFQLTAEIIWLLYLFVADTQIRPHTKRERIGRLLSLAGMALPPSDLFGDSALEGLAKPGTAYLTGIWRETAFLIMLMREWKSLPSSERVEFCSSANPWPLCDWITSIEDGSVRAFRHMILYLCFPDFFERICSKTHKQRIYNTFQKLLLPGADPYVGNKTPCTLDRALYGIRQALVKERATSELDFYLPPLRELWLGSDEPEPDKAPIIVAPPPKTPDTGRPRRFWIEKTIVQGRPDREGGPHRLGLALWSPQRARDGRNIYANMEEVREGDVIYHFTDNQGITGVSVAAGSADDRFTGVPGTEWGDRAAYRVPLQGYQRLDPILDRRSVLGAADFQTQLKELAGGERGRGLFYNVDLDLNQGAYLTEAPPELVQVLNAAYRKVSGKPLPFAEIVVASPAARPPYSIDEALKDLFLEKVEAERILTTWRKKKNIILQGPPGVGKSFAARRLAYALIGYLIPDLIGYVQFHQSYSYEDFVQGYRPVDTGFALRNGRFFEFCEKARQEPTVAHVFIIDEINRGNVSKIFGELMMLIEADKRDEDWQLPLAYSKASERFFVPENVFVLGLMNTADRSLAVVDYALRRRFAFFNLPSRVASKKFSQALSDNGLSDGLIAQIQARVGKLNEQIMNDTANLGPGFAVGHSFFCGTPGEGTTENDWYRAVVETEILPLLEEYWFDSQQRVAQARELLLDGI